MIDLGLALRHVVLWFHWYCDPTFTLIKNRLPCHRFIEYKFSTFNVFHVPTSLSLHIPLGSSYGFVDFPVPVTLQGFSYIKILLTLIYHTYVCTNISVSREIHPYIRNFVRADAHSCHGHFIDFRIIDCPIHLWTGFPLLAYQGSSHATSPSF